MTATAAIAVPLYLQAAYDVITDDGMFLYRFTAREVVFRYRKPASRDASPLVLEWWFEKEGPTLPIAPSRYGERPKPPEAPSLAHPTVCALAIYQVLSSIQIIESQEDTRCRFVQLDRLILDYTGAGPPAGYGDGSILLNDLYAPTCSDWARVVGVNSARRAVEVKTRSILGGTWVTRQVYYDPEVDPRRIDMEDGRVVDAVDRVVYSTSDDKLHDMGVHGVVVDDQAKDAPRRMVCVSLFHPIMIE